MSKEEQYTIQPTHITLPHSDYIDLQYKANAYDQIISVDNKAMNDLTTILAIFVEEGYDVGDGTIIYDMVHFRDTKAFHRYEKYAENLKNYILKAQAQERELRELKELIKNSKKEMMTSSVDTGHHIYTNTKYYYIVSADNFEDLCKGSE